MSAWTIVATPVDDLLVKTDGSAVTGIEFAPHGSAVGERDDSHPVLVTARAQLEEYFARDRHDFDLPLRPAGTPFQQRVWEALRTIPYGRTVTYGEVARRIGMDPRTTSRAVGTANGSNPIPVVIPCHRVIGANGTLTGFGGGLARKQVLLTLEQDTLF
jgi:methylated-DNA-[protein]-cysteine S-methyltransferase